MLTSIGCLYMPWWYQIAKAHMENKHMFVPAARKYMKQNSCLKYED